MVLPPCPDSPSLATARRRGRHLRAFKNPLPPDETPTKSTRTSSNGNLLLRTLQLASTQRTSPQHPLYRRGSVELFSSKSYFLWLRSSLGCGQALPSIPCHCRGMEIAVALGPFSLVAKRCQQRASVPRAQLPVLR